MPATRLKKSYYIDKQYFFGWNAKTSSPFASDPKDSQIYKMPSIDYWFKFYIEIQQYD